MALVGKVGRKRCRARLAMLLVYLALCLGAVTTVYPFLLMISTSLKGASDQNDYHLQPEYFSVLSAPGTGGLPAKESLLGKYLQDKYSGDEEKIRSARASSSASPSGFVNSSASEQPLRDGRFPLHAREHSRQTQPSLAMRGPETAHLAKGEPSEARAKEGVKQQVANEPPNQLITSTNSPAAAREDGELANREAGTENELANFALFLENLPPSLFEAGFRTQTGQVTGRLAERYQSWLRNRYGSIEKLNRAYLEEGTAFETIVPPTEMLTRKDWHPPDSRKYREWVEFKTTLPTEFRIPITLRGMYQEFMRSKYKNQFSAVPPADRVGSTSFATLTLPLAGASLAEFKTTALPDAYRNGAADTLWTRDHSEAMPIAAFEDRIVKDHASDLRQEFATRNYRYVLNYVAINGRSLWNTVIFCFLAIATQLIVNPLAAYALARYPISATGKILLFLLATMAFPAEVAMIPSFLLLKQLHLLNTFSALVLPSAASGYMIFLLKGFFDSLPRELYEAGQMDGARETTMMLRIALPLSKPVLGYLALMAFMAAYGSFMYAFLVAQDQRIWTLMVWIYNLQTYAPKAVIMAALVVAALPTLVVFLFAQRVIMRGIILPGER